MYFLINDTQETRRRQFSSSLKLWTEMINNYYILLMVCSEMNYKEIFPAARLKVVQYEASKSQIYSHPPQSSKGN